MIIETVRKCMMTMLVAMIAMLIIVLSTGAVFADDKTVLSGESNGISITPIIEDDVYYLYLPNDKNLNISEFELHSTKAVKKFNKGVFSETENGDNIYTYRGDFSQFGDIDGYCLITFEDGSSVKLVVEKSTLPSISVDLKGTTLSDITSGSKDIKYPGNTVSVTDEKGNLNAQGIDNVQIKGRGNSTWRLDKKPYQIKFDSKTSVLGMTKAKKWVLLANHLDGSLLRNKISYDLAVDSGVKGGVLSKFADLWIDGEYQGNYLICQKVDSGSGNLNLSSNGILAEMDNLHYDEEEYWFFSGRSNSYFTLKECNSEEKASDLFDEFENRIDTLEKLIYAEKKDWNKISALINEESFAKMYLIYEFTENEDAMKSSVFFHCDADEISMGPAWDFDRSLGNCNDHDPNVAWLCNKVRNDALLSTYFNELKSIPEFNELVKKEYNENFKAALDASISNINTYADGIRNSAVMNQMVWKTFGNRLIASMKPIAGNYQKNVDELSEWMRERKAYMDKVYEISYISGNLPDDGYYIFTSCADKNANLAVNEEGQEYVDHTSGDSVNKSNKFRITNLSDNIYRVTSLYSGKKSEKGLVDAGNGYYYIQDAEGRYLTYDNGKVVYKVVPEVKLGAAQKWVLYRTAVKTVDNGVYVMSPNSNENLALGVENGAIEKRALIGVASNDNRTDQMFYVEYAGNGYYTIKSEKTGYVLDIVNGSTEAGAQIQQYTNNGSDGQLWTFIENMDGTYTIVSKKGTVMSLSGKVPGHVITMDNDGSDARKWTMKAPAKSIDEGNYKIVNYKNTDRIMGIKDNSARIADRKSDNTSFTIKWNAENQAYIIMQGNRALTFAKGSKAYLQDYKSESAQFWYIEPSGNETYIIRCKANGIVGTSSESLKIGNYIRMLTPQVSESLRWEFVSAEETDYAKKTMEIRDSLLSGNVLPNQKGCRFSGKDRFKTAITIADGIKDGAKKSEFDSIIIASGENYPDALAGSALVRSKDTAPIILVNRANEKNIITYVRSNLSSHGRVYLLGGTGVISERFESDLRNCFKNREVSITRLSGANRYSTNLEILRNSGLEGEELVVCGGNGYADSLSVSATGKPIMLVDKSLSSAQQEFIEKEIKPSKITLIGGSTVVSNQIEQSLKTYAKKNNIELERIYGDTRYETSVKIAEKYFVKESMGGVVSLAYGGNFPDGLSGSSLAISMKSPLVLVDKNRGEVAKQYVSSNAINRVAVLGGTGVIADDLIRDIMGQ